MHPPRMPRITGPYFRALGCHKHPHSILRIQPAFAKHVARRPNDSSSPKISRWSGSATLKSSTTASLFVSLAGFLIWSTESNNQSNDKSEFGENALIQGNFFQS